MGMDDAYGNGFPLFHVGGFVGLLPSLILGVPTYMPKVGGFDGEDFVNRCAELGATHIGLVPSQLVLLARKNVAPQPKVRAVITGGAPPTSTTLDAVRSVYPAARYINAFGQTELSGNVAYGIFDEAPERPTIGQVQPLSTYTTRDALGGQELLVQSPALFASYLIGDERIPGPGPGEWHSTGDLVVAEEGDLMIAGRASDLIISGGENVRPEEVAQVIDSVDGVVEVAVVGIPDETWGEVPLAYVTPAKGRDTDALLAAIRETLAANLARYKIPRQIVLLDDMPRTGTGKVDRQHLKKAAAR
jgi:acyl-CoA synthetase (AMP-forming)/AMP-acid ligase II